MPLLIYGANLPYDEEITLDRFVKEVDDSSWEEFMPRGVSKEVFKQFKKYYDEDIFIAAGRRIRNIAREADTLNPTERAKKIGELFSLFRNPDKETVLTPWSVVNMHISNHLGGYDFYDEKHEVTLDEPRFVDRGQVTANTLCNTEARVLDINSKTGLYPLYVAHSIYSVKCQKYSTEELTRYIQQDLWNDTIKNNVYVICKTPMAKQITQRTLQGYSNIKVNAHYFDDLTNIISNKRQLFIEKVLKSRYWKKDGGEKMKFDAVIGNPPYQEETVQKESKTNGQAPRKSIFQHFQVVSDEISSGVISLIYPGARWIHRSGKGMTKFGLKQINDITLERLDFYPDSTDVFKGVAIGDGISIVYKNKFKKSPGFKYVYHKDGNTITVEMDNPGDELMALNPSDGIIIKKIDKFVNS